jgi:hypothetical protein
VRPAVAPATPASTILALQASAGNAAVSRYLARFAVAGATVDVDTVDAATAASYLQIWKDRGEAKHKLTISSEDALALAKRKMSTSAEGAACLASQTQAEERAAELKEQLKADAGKVAEIDAALKRARAHKDAAVNGLGFLGASRDVAALEKAVAGHYKARQGAWEQVRDTLAKFAKEAEAADKRAKIAGDVDKLADLRADAAEERKPLDDVLKAFAPEVTKIIPGATFGYRGSLARGVKSPSKFTKHDNTFSMAHFDSTGVRQAKSDRPAAVQTNPVSYDCDAYIEVPDKKFDELRFVEGPLRSTKHASPELRALGELEKVIDAAIKAKVKPLMPGLDTSAPFGLFLSSSSKVTAQLETGTPYPAFMLEQEFPHLAGATTYSMEPIRKLREYISDVVSHKEQVFPLSRWEPFFRKLYEHVVAKGPTAVVLPEVQVNLTAGGKEQTADPRPREGAIRGPYDVVRELGFTFAARAQPGKVAVGKVYEGTVMGKEGKLTKINLGQDKAPVYAVCANPHSKYEGVSDMFEVTGHDGFDWTVTPASKPDKKR